MITTQAHDTDVNVIHWNSKEPFIISGGDDGIVKIWDLRQIQTYVSVCLYMYVCMYVCMYHLSIHSFIHPSIHPSIYLSFYSSGNSVASFKHHTGPITSVEWHPSDSSVFASAGEDNQVRYIYIIY